MQGILRQPERIFKMIRTEIKMTVKCHNVRLDPINLSEIYALHKFIDDL